MTISSSLNAGVSGLNVNASRLATISENIANSETFGYKRSDVDFASLVVSQTNGNYSAGGVRAYSFKDVDAPVSLLATANALDIAVDGAGMMPVTDVFGTTQANNERDFMMVPTGSFKADEQGLLRTLSGLYLMGWPADDTGGFQTITRDSTTGLEPVNTNISQFSATATQNLSIGLNLPANATAAGATGQVFDVRVDYYDSLGRTHQVQLRFTPNIPADGFSNSWSVELYDTAGDPDAVVGSFDITFSESNEAGGSIQSITAGPGTTYDPVTGELTFDVDNNTLNAFLGTVGSSAGITQLEAPFAPHTLNKDGAPIGNLNSVEITKEGVVEAIYDSGFRRAIYQIPIVTVPNPVGLNPVNNQAYQISSGSGDLYLWDAGTGPAGSFEAFAMMESNTDIAAELTSLIETQRAYSSNAKVIQTVDEMLQETTNLKR